MFDIVQFRDLIVKPSLNALQMYSKAAEELLIFTCGAESDGGTLLKQIKGPALGVYQMEPATYYDIWQNYISNRGSLTTLLAMNFNANRMDEDKRLIYDLNYATAMARIFYRRFSEPLPKETDIKEMWVYYKKYYNTEKGKATEEHAVKGYKRFAKIKD